MRIDAVLALDLGTGGCKSSLWDAQGAILGETVRDYPTAHPHPGWNEQNVDDWWRAVVGCTQHLLARRDDVAVTGVSVSGHSLGVVLLDSHGEPVERTTPIWSDTRAIREAEQVFTELDEEDWYLRTGSGFTPALYPLAKARWYARHRPESWQAARTLIGCKDWINYRLTGEIATDHSYASGSGMYDLRSGRYSDDLVAAAGVTRAMLPEPRASHAPVGHVTDGAAAALGVPAGAPVFTGAVDNACMALGSLGVKEGRIYASFGSSSWATVTSTRPVLDARLRPFVFSHALPGHFISALSTFSSGTSMAWLHEMIGAGISLERLLDEGAAVPADADVPTFVPTLSGGTPLEGGAAVRGVMAGLDLGHGRARLARAGMEGIAFTMRRSLDALSGLIATEDRLLISGGGARHDGWNQIYADVLGRALVRTTVDHQAAALGAATIAFVGLGTWASFADAELPHAVRATYAPDPMVTPTYDKRRRRFTAVQQVLATTGGTFESSRKETL